MREVVEVAVPEPGLRGIAGKVMPVRRTASKAVAGNRVQPFAFDNHRPTLRSGVCAGPVPALAMNPEAVTLKDIARAAGLCHTTISRALREDPRIAAETRARVRALADQLGYRPNPLFAALSARARRRGREQLDVPLAYVTEIPADRKRGSPLSLHSHLHRFGQLWGYKVYHYELASLARTEGLARQLYAQGTAGIILGEHENAERIRSLGLERYPVIGLGGNTLDFPIARVRVSVFRAIHLAWQRMRAHGYQRIGAMLLRHPGRNVVDDDRLREAAILLCQAEQTGTEPPIPTFLMNEHQDRALALRDWVGKYQPEAVLGFAPTYAQRLEALGLSVPAEVAFAALHVAPDQPDQRGIAGILKNEERLAREAINLMDCRVRYGHLGLHGEELEILLMPEWRDGDTLPHRVSGA